MTSIFSLAIPALKTPTLTIPALTIPVLLAATILGGCASPNVQVGVQTRAEIYDATLDVPDMIAATPPSLAILPATVTGTSVGFSPFVNISIDRLVRRARRGETGTFISFLPGFGDAGRRGEPPLSIVSVSEVVNEVNASGRAAALTALLDDTSKDGVADRARLRPIAEVLGVEYLMIPWLAGVHTDNASRFTFAGLAFVRTGWISIEITLQLWHAPTGRLVWQCVGSGNIVGEGVVGTSPALADSIEQILHPMLQIFISGESDVVLSTEMKGSPPVAPAEDGAEADGATTSPNRDPASEAGADSAEESNPEGGGGAGIRAGDGDDTAR